jgi:hypothetical protein
MRRHDASGSPTAALFQKSALPRRYASGVGNAYRARCLNDHRSHLAAVETFVAANFRMGTDAGYYPRNRHLPTALGAGRGHERRLKFHPTCMAEKVRSVTSEIVLYPLVLGFGAFPFQSGTDSNNLAVHWVAGPIAWARTLT